VDDLTKGELTALRNLARKGAGEAVPFVNIADAQNLTEQGLARRSREGWDITPQGGALLARLDNLQGPGLQASPPPDPAR
jgi:hypothetical protein